MAETTGLSVSEKAVLFVVAFHDGGAGCNCKRATIAREAGCSVATVKRCLASLVRRDLLSKRITDSRYEPNVYRFKGAHSDPSGGSQ